MEKAHKDFELVVTAEFPQLQRSCTDMMKRVIEEVIVQLIAKGILDAMAWAWELVKTPLCS
ncbi:hypothetical protein ACCE15_09000 [Pseudomonas parafulva]|uniref:hypothetical protein n=1 Tax=Pseudomonas parafulva TaxID=157782 RepID=UPI003569CB2F